MEPDSIERAADTLDGPQRATTEAAKQTRTWAEAERPRTSTNQSQPTRASEQVTEAFTEVATRDSAYAATW